MTKAAYRGAGFPSWLRRRGASCFSISDMSGLKKGSFGKDWRWLRVGGGRKKNVKNV
jgi:hypothetical protein